LQGYYFGKPMSYDDSLSFVEDVSETKLHIAGKS
jgi:EAL domain-containing protein (putative c-di-GMP-specific phosphodiesterase class I)